MLRNLFTALVISVILTSIFAQLLPPPRAKLQNGATLHGTHINTVRGRIVDAYLGIPYAEPPKGSLRFANPIPKVWIGDRDARTTPEPCPQFNIYGADRIPFGNEDCLYLNVFTPRYRRKGHPLSVMVWIHGGSYLTGSSDPQNYGPERLLDHNIILVTINYRLGALGFLSTGTGDAPGNFGMKDQILALYWIRANIRSFGGDPNSITLFGSDAGAACVSLHMASPSSRGLFHKAIIQSGSYYSPWAVVSKEKAVNRTEEMAKHLGCPPSQNNDFKDMLECMQKVPVAKIVYRNNPFVIFGPVIEPRTGRPFLVDDPRDDFDAHGNEIPLIIGANADDGLMNSAAIINQYSIEFRRNFDALLPHMLYYDDKSSADQARITDKVENYYFQNGLRWSNSNHQNLTNMFSDRLFFAGVDRFIRQRFSGRNKRIGKTYIYKFNHNGPRSSTRLYGGGPGYYGIAHLDELQFLFPNGQLGIEARKRDAQMHWAMPKMWTDFAKIGDPTPNGSLVHSKWKRTSTYPLRYALIGKVFFGQQQPTIPRNPPPQRDEYDEVENEAEQQQISENVHFYNPSDFTTPGKVPNQRLQNSNMYSGLLNDHYLVDYHDMDYSKLIGRNNTKNKKNHRKRKHSSKRKGRHNGCDNRQYYCTFIQNERGSYWRPETWYLYN